MMKTLSQYDKLLEYGMSSFLDLNNQDSFESIA